MIRTGHIRTDIVLVGGGHAHVHVLKVFAMRPESGVRLTLITRDLETPYSGMLPGVVAGIYLREQAQIDLVRLAAATGARLIHAEAIGLDRTQKRVQLADHAPIAYDVLSIDVGIVPELASIVGAVEHGIAVKPIGSFLAKFDSLVARCKLPDGPKRIAVIGGGAGGVELLLSVRTRLLAEVATAPGPDAVGLSFALITAGEILETHNRRVRDAFRRAFAARGVELYERRRVRELTPSTVEFDNGSPIEIDAALVTTDAAGPPWFRETGLALDSGGFLATGPALQTLNDLDVFAAGDCAALVETPREKAGVFAVRAGAPLAENLRRHVRGELLKPWHPQRQHLALISTGERYAVASRGPFKTEGAWVWRWKNWIDQRWMSMYQDVDRMVARMSARRHEYINDTLSEEMRCGGCGAKIGPGPLSRVLSRLSPARGQGVLIGLDAPDDAAVTEPAKGKMLVQTVDFFPAFIDDPYLLGEIAANHALNDVFAMGGVPRHALATVVVPPGPASKVEEALFQLLSGARVCLDREEVALIGGHSSEGTRVAIGFSVTGEVARDRIVRKAGLKPDDALVLTRPLGTGILFAAAMRARAKAPWIDMALCEMRHSNRSAVAVLAAHGVTAMTDITGFGLIGHLGEMLLASRASATLDLASIPLYEGAFILAREGVTSTLLAENLVIGHLLRGEFDAPTRAVLFDPQTSGGVLAGIPADRAAECVAKLRAKGHVHAAIIGRVIATGLPEGEAAVTASRCLQAASSI
jgi:selenide,water dikinase